MRRGRLYHYKVIVYGDSFERCWLLSLRWVKIHRTTFTERPNAVYLHHWKLVLAAYATLGYGLHQSRAPQTISSVPLIGVSHFSSSRPSRPQGPCDFCFYPVEEKQKKRGNGMICKSFLLFLAMGIWDGGNSGYIWEEVDHTLKAHVLVFLFLRWKVLMGYWKGTEWETSHKRRIAKTSRCLGRMVSCNGKTTRRRVQIPPTRDVIIFISSLAFNSTLNIHKNNSLPVFSNSLK